MVVRIPRDAYGRVGVVTVASEPTLIESVRRALTLLNVVGEADRPLPAKTLARRAALPLPTAYHLLRTLVHEGYLARVDRVGYVLGDQVVALAGQHDGMRGRVRAGDPSDSG